MNDRSSHRPILMFDSGVGGLTVLREARVLMPDRRFVYVADDAAFPYGAWEEPALQARIYSNCSARLLDRFRPGDFGDRLQHRVDAGRRCLARRPFPAILSSARCRRSSRRRSARAPAWSRCWPRRAPSSAQYTRDLISKWATKCHVRLVGSDRPGAHWPKSTSREGFVDEEAVRAEIAPCFVEHDGSAPTSSCLPARTIPSWPTACARPRPGRSTGSIPPRRSRGARCRCSPTSTPMVAASLAGRRRPRRLHLGQNRFRRPAG